MKVVLATARLDMPGGSETYLLTLADHMTRLGADVTILATSQGMSADWARSRGLTVVGTIDELPEDPEVTLAFGAELATELAGNAPSALRLFVAHNLLESQFPAPLEGIVHATIAPNDRLERIARGHIGCGEVIRMRQPIDTQRFSSRGEPSDVPERVLLIGNYHSTIIRSRAAQIKEAWAPAELEWISLGDPEPTMEVVSTIGEADIVVGIGRCILEAMACGRPAYVHDHAGSDGWVTEENYEALESDGFSGAALRAAPDVATLRADLDLYDPHLGRVGQDLVRRHHHARIHTADLMTMIKSRRKVSVAPDTDALQAVKVMQAYFVRADLDAERYRVQEMVTATTYKNFLRTKRYRMAVAIARPLDKLKLLLKR